MTLVKGTNCGFVTEAPTEDPGESLVGISGFSVALKDVAPAGAIRVVEIGWWDAGGSAATDTDLGLYTHNIGDDNPEGLLGKNTTQTPGDGGGWVKVDVDIAITEETTYWIAMQVDVAGNTDRKADAGEKADYKSGQTELVTTWGVSSGSMAYLFAFYAVWEEAPVGTNMKINISDVFKDIESLKINIGNVWKDVVQVLQNIGDVWKTVFG